MWGEDWGTMIWGGAASQVPIGPWALVALGFVLGICALKAKTHLAARLIPVLIAVLLPVLVVSTPALITFVNGTVADADEVNANFQALADAIDAAASSSLTVATRPTQPNVFIPRSAIAEICYDADGCNIRYCYSSGTGGRTLCRQIISFSIAEASGVLSGRVDTSTTFSATRLEGLITYTDNNGFLQEIVSIGASGTSCSFNDADRSLSDGTLVDNAPGFGLVQTQDLSGSGRCVVRFDD